MTDHAQDRSNPDGPPAGGARGPAPTRMIGAILLFVAFVTQNAVLPLWNSRSRTLERSQVLFDIEQLRRELWTTALSLELGKARPDSAALGRCLVRTLEANRNLVIWSAGGKGRRSAPEQAERLAVRERQLRQAEQLLAAHRFDSLRVMAQAAAAETRLALPRDDRRFFAILDAIGEREEFWFRIFLLAYATGSVLIAVDAVRRHRASRRLPSSPQSTSGSSASP